MIKQTLRKKIQKWGKSTVLFANMVSNGVQNIVGLVISVSIILIIIAYGRTIVLGAKTIYIFFLVQAYFAYYSSFAL